MADQRLNVIFSGDGTSLNKTIKELEDQLRRFESGLKTASGVDSFQRINRAADETRRRLDLLKNSSQAFGQTVGNTIGRGAQSATFALTNLGRVAQDLPFGFIGIANNLNPLLESFQRLKAETGSSGLALKALGSSLLGAGGLGFALSAVTAILTISQLGFSAWTRGFGNAAKGAGEASREIKSAFDVIDDATDSVQGDIAKVNALVKAATDSGNSFKVQSNAITELQKINKSYFGDLEAGKSTFEQITAAANGYTQALISQAIVKGLQEEISALAKQLREANKEYTRLTPLTDRARKNSIAVAAAAGNEVKGIASVTSGVADAQTEYDKYNKRLVAAATNVGDLNTKFKELSDEIQKQVGISLNLKPLEDSGKKAKDITDDIIARAKLFVKEFGEVFVVPELEITFFKNKDAVLKDAKKLLADVASGNLQIKLPVNVDFELLPESTGVTQSVIDNFFKQGKDNLEIPVGLKLDATLFKANLDKIDRKLDFRKKFSVLGDVGLKEFNKLKDIDFTSINGKIDEATKKLQNMLDLANTLSQAIGQGLTNAFNSLFDAILEGKNAFKALGEALKQLIIGTIKAIAQMLILKIVTQIIFKGGGAAVGGGGGTSSFRVPGSSGLVKAPSFTGGAFGGRSAPTLVAQVSGTQLQFVLTQGANQISRIG